MAILDKNGNYLKVNLDRCYADIQGFHVAFEVHRDLKTRNDEKVREEKVRLLEEKANDLYSRYIKEVNLYAAKNNITLPDEEEKLPDDLKSKLEIASDIFTDVHRVKIGIYRRGDQQLMPRHMDVLISLGLEEDWFENSIENPINVVEISSPYNRQRFDYETAYSEMKKTIKEGFKDC